MGLLLGASSCEAGAPWEACASKRKGFLDLPTYSLFPLLTTTYSSCSIARGDVLNRRQRVLKASGRNMYTHSDADTRVGSHKHVRARNDLRIVEYRTALCTRNRV